MRTKTRLIIGVVILLLFTGSVYTQTIKNPYWPSDPPTWKMWNTNPTTVTDAALIAPGQVGKMAPTAVTNRLFPDDIITPGKYLEYRTTDWAGRKYAGFWDDVYFSVDTNGGSPPTPHSWISSNYSGDALNNKWFNSSSWLNGYGALYGDPGINKFGVNFTSQSTTGMGHDRANSSSSTYDIERNFYFRNCLRAGPSTAASFGESIYDQMFDMYQALVPSYYNSTGQSGTEIYALLKMMIVGGFLPKELKPELKRQGIYMATLLYIWKASLPYDVPYESELRHRVAYSSNGDNFVASSTVNRPFHLYKDTVHMAVMVDMAKNMTVAPPVALIKKVAVLSGTETYFYKTAALIQQASGQQVQLRVSTSDCYDIANRALTMRWKLLYGNQSTTIVDEGGGNFLITVPSNANLPQGRTTILLIANNGIYDSNPACINIYRSTGGVNKRPTFSGATNKVVFPGDTVTFNLTGTDPNGTGYPVSFYKKSYDVGTITGNTYTWVSTTGTTVGVYPVSILASDGTSGTNSTEVYITVSNIVARVTPDITSGAAPLTVNFSSAGSQDSASNPLTYLWNFGDGTTSTAANPSHTFANPSLYRATLTVTSALGSHSANAVIEATKDAWTLDINNGWSNSLGLDTSVWTKTNPANGSTSVVSNVLSFTVTTAPFGIQSVKTFNPPFYMEADFLPNWGTTNDGFIVLGNQLGWTYTTATTPFSFLNLGTLLGVNIGQCVGNERVTARFYVVNDPNNAGKVRYTGYFTSILGSYFFSIDNQSFTPGPIKVVKNGYSENIWSLKVWIPNSVEAPVISSINPAAVVYNNAATLTVTGSGFFGATASNNVSAVKLYTSPVTNITGYSVLTETSIEGVIPEGINAGTYQLKVTTSGGESTSAVFFTITPPLPVVSVISPDNGLKHLVNTISVTGSGFFGGTGSNSVTMVRLTGTSSVTITNAYSVINDTEIQNVIIPSGIAAESYDIRVTTNGGTNTTSLVKYVGMADVTVTEVNPAAAPNTQNTTINITGTGFYAGTGSDSVVSVKIKSGSTEVTLSGWTCISDSMINNPVVPVKTKAGTYDILVTTTSGGNDASLAKLTLTATAPVITALLPNSCVYDNSLTVTITGSGFYGGTDSADVRVINLTSDPITDITVYSVASDTNITGAVFPGGAKAGTYSIVIGTGGGNISSGDFVVIPPVPLVTNLTPASGDKSVNNTIKVIGNGFFGGIGSNSVTMIQLAGISTVTITNAYSVTNDTEIQNVVIPAGINAGTYDVKITATGGTNTTSSVKYEVLNDTFPPTVISATADESTVKVTFSEEITMTTATNKANYALESPMGTSKSLASAVISYANKVTTIGNLALTAALTFKITVSNVSDLFSNPIAGSNTANGTVQTTPPAEFKCNIKSSGGDYTGLNSWSTAVACDLTSSSARVYSISANSSPVIEDGGSVTGQTSGATGTCVHVSNTSNNSQILIKNISGTFENGEVVQKTGDASKTVTLSSAGCKPIASAVCYSFTDSTGAAIGTNWTTSSSNYVYVYTHPTARHAGKWDDAKYILSAASGIDVSALNVIIEGIQIKVANGSWGFGIKYTPAGAGWVKIIGNIIRANSFSGVTDSTKGIWLRTWNATHYVYNNVIYDFVNGATYTNHMGIFVDSGTAYLYNNTIQNCRLGVYDSTSNTTINLRNNIAQDCTDGYSGTMDTCDYNISDLAGDAAGSHSKNSATVLFKDKAGDDFHLGSGDTAAKGSGVDLSAVFTTDIDGDTRQTPWDIGADGAASTSGPIVTSFTPVSSYNIAVTTLSIQGSGFFGGGSSSDVISVKITTTPSETDLTGYTVISDTIITTAVLGAGITAGSYNIKVYANSGTATLGTYVVSNPPQPAVTNVNPSSGGNNSDRTIMITGSGFYGGAGSNSVTGIQLAGTSTVTITNAYNVASDTQIQGVIIKSGITAGTYDVKVTTSVGTSVTNANTKYTATSAIIPVITSLNPSGATYGQAATVAIAGSCFYGGTGSENVSMIRLYTSPTTTTITGFSVVSDTVVTNVVVPGTINTGTYQMKVTTGIGESLGSNFVINPPVPAVSNVVPNSGYRHLINTLSVYGTGFFGGVGSNKVTMIQMTGASTVTITNAYNVASDTEIQNVIVNTGITAGTYDVKVTTNGGTNTTSAIKYAALADTTAPTVVTAVVDTTTVNVTFSEDISLATATNKANYKVESPTGTNKDLSGAVLSYANNVTTITGLAFVSTNTFRITVTGVQDLAGNAIAGNNVATGTVSGVDSTAPASCTVTINGGASFAGSTTVTLTLTGTDAESGMGQMQFSNTGTAGTWSTPEIYSTTKVWTLSVVDGSKTVYAKFSDNAGNWTSSVTDGIILDTTAPVSGSVSANAGEAYTTSTSVTLALSASDGTGSGVVSMQISNNGTGWTDYVYAVSIPWTLLPGDGTKTVYAKFKDNIGNWTSTDITDNIIYDTTAPVSGSVSINAGAAYTTGTSVTLTLSASDGTGSGVVSMQISNNGSSWTDYAYGTNLAWTLLAGDGTKTVYAKFKDNAGNWTGNITDNITLDTGVPISCSVSINGGTAYANSTTVTLMLSATDTGSGLASMQISNDNSIWSMYAYSTTRTWTLTTVDGTKTVYARFMDNVGNWTVSSVTDGIALDTASPTGNIEINAGAVYSNSLIVNLTLSAADANGISGMQFSNTGLAGTWSTLENLNTTKTWTLIAGDGTKTVYVKYTDNAGNSSDISTTIIYDIAGPVGSLTVNGGESRTRSTIVTLGISADDITSGMNEMQFSEGGTVWSTLEPYVSGTRIITLSSNNEKKSVQARYYDNAGNMSLYSQDIKLVTVNRLVVQTQGEAVAGMPITFTVSAYADSMPVTGYLDTVKFVSTDVSSSTIADYQFMETDSGVVTIIGTLGTIGKQDIEVIDKEFGDITGKVTIKVYQAMTVDGTKGTIIANPDGTSVEILAGAFTGSKNVGFAVTENPPSFAVNYKYRDTVKPISRDFGELDTTTSPWTFKPMVFNWSVPISIPYTPAEVGDINENSLRLFYYNETTGKYTLVEGIQEVKGGKVTAQVSHFSTYRIFGTYVSGNLNNVIVYPNPYRQSTAFEGKLKFINLPIDSIVTIYNIAGEKVREIKESDLGNLGWIEWDGKNDTNELVGRGVYLYVVAAADGSKKVGKFGMIK